MIAQPHRTSMRLAALLLACAAMAACGSSPAVRAHSATSYPAGPQPQAGPVIGERAAAIALQQLGTPYRYGGSAPPGFDCSGLVQYSYRKAGKALPRTTGALWASTETVSAAELAAGDLLFFEVAGKMQHVGLYVGDGRFVHAPSTGRHVSVESIDSAFYSEALLRAGRPR